MKLGQISREDILGELERGGFAAGTIGEEGRKPYFAILPKDYALAVRVRRVSVLASPTFNPLSHGTMCSCCRILCPANFQISP